MVRAVSAFALCLLVCPAFAEDRTLAELKNIGAQKVTRDEIAGVVAGKTVRFELDRSNKSLDFDKDGKVRGSMSLNVGKGRGAHVQAAGDWRVDDDRLCLDVQWHGARGGGGPEQWCRVVYRQGADYFAFDEEKDDSRPHARFVPDK